MLNQDQTAALQELANIGMGQAGADIARVWQELVTLSVPRIHQVPVHDLPPLVAHLIGAERVHAVHQSFRGSWGGEALVLFTTAGRQSLTELMTPAGDGVSRIDGEQLLSVSEIVARTCLRTIANQLGADIAFTGCALAGEDLPVSEMAFARLPSSGTALCLEVRFRVESRRLAVHLVLLMPHDEVAALAGQLDAFLEALMDG